MDTEKTRADGGAAVSGEGVWTTPAGHALPRVLDATVSMDLVQRYVEVERRRNRRFLAFVGSAFLFVSLLIFVVFVSIGLFVLRNSRKAASMVSELQAQTAVYAVEIFGVTNKLGTLEHRSREVSTQIARAEEGREKEKRVLMSDLERFSRWVAEGKHQESRTLSDIEARLRDMEAVATRRQEDLDSLRKQYAALTSAGTFLLEKGAVTGAASAAVTAPAEAARPGGADLPDTKLSTGTPELPVVDVEDEIENSLADFRGKREMEISVVTFPSGDRYEGEFKDGLMNGWGVYYFRNGDKYEGEFRHDLRSGRGVLTYANGDRYVGEFEDDLRSGRGSMTYQGGDKYVGEFQGGSASGKGTIVYQNGNRYGGDFRNGMKHGNGVFRFANGDVYEGEFRDDVREGKGTYFFSDGNKYIGEFRAGQRHGRGRYVYAGGEEYIGDFRNGKKDGEGVCVYPDGQRMSGRWKDDRLIEFTEG